MLARQQAAKPRERWRLACGSSGTPSPRHFLRKIFEAETLGVDLSVSRLSKTKARQRPGQASFLKFSISGASRGFPQGAPNRQTPGAKASFLFGPERPEPEGSGYLEAKANTGILRLQLRMTAIEVLSSPDLRIETWAPGGFGAKRVRSMQWLPDAAVFGWRHGLAFLAAEGRAEAGLVDDGSVGAEVVGRVGVGLDLGADDLGA